jgi:hypothetical protein
MVPSARLRRAATGGSLALSLAACTPAKAPASARLLDEIQKSPDSFVAEVARVRGLAVRHRVRIVMEDDATFRRSVLSRAAAEELPVLGGDTIAFYLAFNFPLPPLAIGAKSGPKAPALDDLTEEQLIGFYEEASGTVHVRRSKLARAVSGADESELRFVLAHEVEHALIHQTFGSAGVSKLTNDDLFLARAALHEGDASVAGLAHVADRMNRPLRRVLARAGEWIGDGSQARLAASHGDDKALRSAPPNERERLMFPYFRGLTFAGDLYRAGGFPLLDRAFRSPPESTEQVLHPEKFLRGEAFIDVDPPPVPAGFRHAVSGKLGELLTAVALAQCIPRDAAALAAEGWGGDAYSIAVNDQGQAALVWSTVWDDEPSAKRFADTVSQAAACWNKPVSYGRISLLPRFEILRSGVRVALGRGLDGPASTPALESALAQPVRRRIAPALSAITTIPPVRPRPPTTPWTPVYGGFANPMLGITIPAYPGFSVEFHGDPPAILQKRDDAYPALFALEVSDEVDSPRSRDREYAEMLDALRKAGVRLDLVVTHDGPFRITLGPAHVREWGSPGTEFGMRVVSVPVCDGTGALVLSSVWGTVEGRAAADGFLMGARRYIPRAAICDLLDPLGEGPPAVACLREPEAAP